MPHHILAAILIQLDQHDVGKQEILCFKYALATGLHVIGKCHHPDEALAMVMAGTVAAVITAVDPRGHLAQDLARFSGQLHIVREAPRPKGPDAGELCRRLYRSGLDTQQIATILEVPPEQVRRHRNLRRHE